MSESKCPRCGSSVPLRAAWCFTCGAVLGTGDEDPRRTSRYKPVR